VETPLAASSRVIAHAVCNVSLRTCHGVEPNGKTDIVYVVRTATPCTLAPPPGGYCRVFQIPQRAIRRKAVLMLLRVITTRVE